MNIELSDTDVVFIYGHFLKQLAEIDKIAASPGCPFDKPTIKNQKTPYLSITEKLDKQIPGLKKLNNQI